MHLRKELKQKITALFPQTEAFHFIFPFSSDFTHGKPLNKLPVCYRDVK